MRVCVGVCACVRVCVHVCACVDGNVCRWASMHVSVLCVCVCMCVCV